MWTDKFNIFIALLVPPLVVTLIGLTTDISGSTHPPIDCVLVSYDSNTFINENNFTESDLDDYSANYFKAVNNSNLLNLVQFFNATEDIYAMETARNYLISKKIKIIIVIPFWFSRHD